MTDSTNGRPSSPREIPAAPTSPNGTAERFEPTAVARRLLRQWKIAAAVGVTTLAAGTLVVWRSIDLYEAEGLVRVRPERSAIPGQGTQAMQMQSPLMPGAVDYVLTQINLARSERVLSPVVDSLGLRLVLLNPRVRRTALLDSVVVPPEAPTGRYVLELEEGGCRIVAETSQTASRLVPYGTPLQHRGVTILVRARRAGVPARVKFAVVSELAALQSLRDLARLTAVRSTDLVRVAVRSNDPVYAARVANAVEYSFANFALDRARAESGQQSEYLQRELGRTEAELGRSRQQLGARQSEELAVDVPLVTQALIARAAENEDQLASVRAELSVLTEAMSRLGDERALTSSTVGVLNVNPAAAGLVSMLAAALSEKERLIASRAGAENLRLRAANAQIASLGQQLVSLLEGQLKTVRARERALVAQQESLNRELSQLPGRVNSQARLQENALGLGKVTGLLRERWYLTQIERNSLLGAVQIIDPARPPLEPFGMRRNVRLLIVLVLAGALGLGAAVMAMQFDGRVLDGEDATRATRLPLLAEIPRTLRSRRAAGGKAADPPLHDPTSPVGEAYRLLRTNVLFAQEAPPRVVQIVSPSDREDHTTVALNLAAALAHQGLGVALVDADLRRGRLHQAFDAAAVPGLTEVLSGTSTIEQALRRIPGGWSGSLALLPAGTRSCLSPELLGSPEAATAIQELRRRFDAVVLDSPPISGVTDAAVIARLTDGVVLVARSGTTTHQALTATARELGQIHTTLIGIVLDGTPADATSWLRGRSAGGHADSPQGGTPRGTAAASSSTARQRSAASLL